MTKGVVVIGVPIDNVSMEETLRRIEDFVLEGSFHQIATANVDFLVNAVGNRKYKEILCQCDLVLADGMPIVWASHLLGAPLAERVTGADLVPRLAQLSKQKDYGIFLLGATAEVCEVAAARLEEMGARIAGKLAPPLCGLDKFDNDHILAEIEKANPDILLVALGSPKQEKWIHQHRDRLKVPVCIGVGGSLDFLAGAIPRAPGWMQRGGLEWLCRLWAEPRRLAPRYLKDALGMARYFSVQLAFSMGARRSGAALQIGIESIGSVSILSASGMMTGSRLDQLELMAFSRVSEGGGLVVELAGVSYLGADGIRALAGLRRLANNRGCQLWLAGMPLAFARTLKASRCEGMFQKVPSVFYAVRQSSWGRQQTGRPTRQLNSDFPGDKRAPAGKSSGRVVDSNELVECDASGVIEPTQSVSHLAVGNRAPLAMRKR
jgi:N-acetylglucosaminyldiphosphoundecaprenol N-acetyl-beta-D-mannosaminyltransferase